MRLHEDGVFHATDQSSPRISILLMELPRCPRTTAMKGPLRLVHTVALFGIISLTGCRTAEPPLPTLSSDSHEVDVIAAFFTERIQLLKKEPSFLVVCERTDPVTGRPVRKGEPTETDRLLGDSSSSVPRDLLEDFCSKNLTAWRLPQELTNRVQMVLLSRERLNFLQSRLEGAPPDSRTRFADLYPRAWGPFHFSRVGFSRSGEQALLTTGTPYFGETYLATKTTNGWAFKLSPIGRRWVQ